VCVFFKDLAGVFINGADCLLIAEWKSPSKIIALAPAREGRGDIIIATKSGGVGSCSVQFKVFKENVGPLKESAVWVNEKYHPRRHVINFLLLN
jgi:exocyst complex component 2